MTATLRAGCKTTCGFTLVELLVTTFVLGVLCLIALRYVNARDTRYIAEMRAELENVSLAQAFYYDENGRYASTLSQLDVLVTGDVQVVVAGGRGGFAAQATHTHLVDTRCALFSGTVDRIFSPATEDGRLVCGT